MPNTKTRRSRLKKPALLVLAVCFIAAAVVMVGLGTDWFHRPETADNKTMPDNRAGGITNTAEAGCLNCDVRQTPESSFSIEPGRELPDVLYGVTTESVKNLDALAMSLERHKKRPTVRIVFQKEMMPADYRKAVSRLRNSSYLMGEIVDSEGFGSYSLAKYRNRVREYIGAFGNQVDVWEIGNELNGEWLDEPELIRQKTQAAYEIAEHTYAHLNLRTAITLNYWPSTDCYALPWEDTETFARSLPGSVKKGIDYVLLSFYETACDPVARPSAQDIAGVFTKLKTIFPNARIGFGEAGAQGEADGFAEPGLAEKQRIAQTYYGMHSQLNSLLGKRYAGGYFWWYYYQDAVPYDKPGSMWPTIEKMFNSY